MNMGQRSLQRKLFIPIDTFNFVAKIKILLLLSMQYDGWSTFQISKKEKRIYIHL